MFSKRRHLNVLSNSVRRYAAGCRFFNIKWVCRTKLVRWTQQILLFFDFYTTFHIIKWYLAISNPNSFLFLKFNQASLYGCICRKRSRLDPPRPTFKNKSSSIPLKDKCIEKSLFWRLDLAEDKNSAWCYYWSIIAQCKMNSNWCLNKISLPDFRQYIFTYTLVFVRLYIFLFGRVTHSMQKKTSRYQKK